MVDPPTVENYEEYAKTILRGIAVGYGVTYEELTRDHSNVNFSAGKMGWISYHKDIKRWQKQIMLTQFLKPIVADFKNVLTIMGINEENLVCMFGLPKREMIDPTKEVPAKIKAIRGGLSTLSDEILSMGKDPKQHFDQIKKDNEMLDKLELVLDSDPRLTVMNGKLQDTGSEEGDEIEIENEEN